MFYCLLTDNYVMNFFQLLDNFESLCKLYSKSKNVIAKEGIPPFYVKNLVETNDYLNEVFIVYVQFNSNQCLLNL